MQSGSEAKRDRKTGRYAESKLGKPCACGHALGQHTAAVAGGERPCLADGCECERFKAGR